MITSQLIPIFDKKKIVQTNIKKVKKKVIQLDVD